jgi:nucleotide-binding universal stress UspA family protein
MTTESGVRHIVVGVDGSAESVAALRWACREASFCAAEVLAVLALESACHQIASYAVPVPRQPRGSWGGVREVLRRAVGEAVAQFPGVSVRTDIAEGLAARVLLDHASDADMLVLGRTPYGPDPCRAAGPVTRACLRSSVCPVVIIGSGPTDPAPEEVPLAAQAAEHPVDHLPPSWQRDLEGSGAAR